MTPGQTPAPTIALSILGSSVVAGVPRPPAGPAGEVGDPMTDTRDLDAAMLIAWKYGTWKTLTPLHDRPTA
ncbi:hypothetical protein ACH4T9_13740 [Micromonospora sp. NPDC020750]|uniref:hypothetical protein n=1 Tax=unclassified Micromonospora TaxID=2617518 RepID=UPI0037AE926A